MPKDNITENPHNPEELLKENRSLKRQLRNLEATLQRIKAMLAARTTVNSVLESEQKKMERNLNLLLDNSADMILLFDMNGCFSYVSQTFLDATGIIGAGVINGKHFTEVFTQQVSGEWAGLIESNFALALERRNTVGLNTSVDLSGGGTPRDYDVQFTPMVDHRGELEAFMMLLHDTTEIINSKRQAESASLSKSQFLATMSHEIRTPMNAILGITEIQLQKETLDLEIREALGKIYSSGDLLLGIINDILDLSKIEAGKLEFTIDKYEVASVLNDTAQLNIMRIGSKPIEFELYVDPDTPATLSGDELRVKQIFNNILSNAFKYTASGTVGLSVAAEPAEREDQVTLVFRVSDTGQGMTAEQVEKLFDDYSRFNMEANRSTEGTGLGMSITRNLIRLMNGKISVESEPGKGSVFTVALPQGRIGAAVLGREMTENLQQFRANSITQMKRVQISREPMPYGKVLIVDDVETNIYVAKGLLTPYELKVDEADSGFAAIDIIKKGYEYDVIFMDHMMPKMDGIEATKIIRELGYDKPIVALTANAVSGQAEIFLGSGFDDFISKPIDIRLLNAVLNKLVRDRQPPEVVEEARKQAAQKERQVAEGAPLPVTDPLFAEIFVRDAQKAITVLETLCQKNDYRDEDDLRTYIINVHGMKSALANIGKAELSAVALRLEAAGREGKLDFIEGETAPFLAALKAYLEEIKPPEEATITDNAAEDKAYLQEMLLAIKAACADFDESTAEDVLTELRSATWSSKTNELLGAISEKLLHSDFDEIETAIDEFLKA